MKFINVILQTMKLSNFCHTFINIPSMRCNIHIAKFCKISFDKWLSENNRKITFYLVSVTINLLLYPVNGFHCISVGILPGKICSRRFAKLVFDGCGYFQSYFLAYICKEKKEKKRGTWQFRSVR